MKARCYNTKHPVFADYGGRGITICDEWKNSRGIFFAWAMAHGYREDLTIDRIDNDRGYEPTNCRWVDAQVQANNTRRNRIIEHCGVRRTLSQWATSAGISTRLLWYRISAGWDFADAITKPARRHTA